MFELCLIIYFAIRTGILIFYAFVLVCILLLFVWLGPVWMLGLLLAGSLLYIITILIALPPFPNQTPNKPDKSQMMVHRGINIVAETDNDRLLLQLIVDDVVANFPKAEWIAILKAQDDFAVIVRKLDYRGFAFAIKYAIARHLDTYTLKFVKTDGTTIAHFED